MDAVEEPLAILFGLLFALVGPIKVIPAFDTLTSGMETRERHLLALKAAAYGALGIAMAALMGQAQVEKVGISHEAVGTAAGLVLAIVGLLPLVGIEKKAGRAATPPDALSVAFTILVPPYAYGLILLISLYIPSTDGQVGIVLVGAILMAMNAVAMILAGSILKRLGIKSAAHLRLCLRHSPTGAWHPDPVLGNHKRDGRSMSCPFKPLSILCAGSAENAGCLEEGYTMRKTINQASPEERRPAFRIMAPLGRSHKANILVTDF